MRGVMRAFQRSAPELRADLVRISAMSVASAPGACQASLAVFPCLSIQYAHTRMSQSQGMTQATARSVGGGGDQIPVIPISPISATRMPSDH